MADLYEAVITLKHGYEDAILRVPIAADFDAKAKNIAGHILRGYCRQNMAYNSVAVYLRILSGGSAMILGSAICIRDGAKVRGPNLTIPTPHRRSPEDKAAAPMIDKVVWR